MSRLLHIMQEPLPTLTKQKRLHYRSNTEEVVEAYDLINEHVFENALSRPVINVKSHCRRYWGKCFGELEPVANTNSFCHIKIMDKFYCKQWMFTILAHEMSHQYQWDIIGNDRIARGLIRDMSHGPSFFIHRARMATHGISLKKWQRTDRWFRTQNLFN